jgi:hypothetical protein
MYQLFIEPVLIILFIASTLTIYTLTAYSYKNVNFEGIVW